MIRHVHGEEIDIHGGGNDLVFPHHENEILQTEACTGGHLARYWMHNGMLETKGADGQAVKMSKSLKNFFSVKDVSQKYDRYTIRFYYLNTHYRSPLVYGEENLEEAKAALGRIWNCYRDLEAEVRNGAEGTADCVKDIIENAKKEFSEGMDDDFNTRAAIESIFTVVKNVNRMISEKTMTKAGAQAVLDLLDSENAILGISPEKTEGDSGLDAAMDILVDLRKELRSRKMYDLADMIRDRLKEAGFALEDSSDGAKWKRI
jgi:cysteinyl-tRNA synthetase